MALSKQQKDELAEHFRGKDLYDPAKDPAQETVSFEPDPVRGEEMPGFAEGGEVGDSPDMNASLDLQALRSMPPGAMPPGLEAPALSAGTDTARGAISGLGAPATDLTQSGLGGRYPSFLEKTPPAGPLPAPAKGAGPLLTPSVKPAAPPVAPGATVAAPQGSGKLSPNEFDQLIAALTPSTGKRVGNAAMLGLAGLADSISTGVARTNGSNFQKNIIEMQQEKRNELINALKAKYEAGFKGQELGLRGKEIEQTGAHQKAEEKQQAAALGLAREKETREGAHMTVEERQKQNELDVKTIEENKYALPGTDRAELRNAAEARLAKAGLPVIKTTAEWAALPKGTKYQDQNGKSGVKK